VKLFDERPSPYGTVTVVQNPRRGGFMLLVPDPTCKPHTWKQAEPGLVFMHPASIEDLKVSLAFDEWISRAEVGVL